MKEKSLNIIIVILVCAIVAAGAAGGFLIYKNNAKSQSGEAAASATEVSSTISGEELEGILRQQMMYVNGINYYYQSSSEQLLHDAMGASVFNNSEVSVKQFTVAFCAYDADGNPIKIRQPEEQDEGGYIRTINYDFANAQGDKTALEPQETCKDILMYVNSEPQIVTIKACVKSYISTEDITWDNPYYKTFTEVYSGKKLI